MEVYVITVEVQRPYEENEHFEVDSVHDSKESACNRIDEIEIENKTMRGSILGNWETFTVQKK